MASGVFLRLFFSIICNGVAVRKHNSLTYINEFFFVFQLIFGAIKRNIDREYNVCFQIKIVDTISIIG